MQQPFCKFLGMATVLSECKNLRFRRPFKKLFLAWRQIVQRNTDKAMFRRCCNFFNTLDLEAVLCHTQIQNVGYNDEQILLSHSSWLSIPT